MKNYEKTGVQIPQVWLPRAGVDLHKWATIACDQFTSQPDYWQSVEALVGDAPSTLHLTFPEVYLERPDADARIQRIQSAMQQYLAQGLLTPHDGMVYVERRIGGKLRRGLVLALDLEQYDYNKGSRSLIRSTEGTIVERLPPRMRIRQGAALELPHILVLIDDPACTVIEPLGAAKERLQPLYDFELMLDSGHLAGYLVNDAALEAQVIQALEALADPASFAQKYAVDADQAVLLFAMGDGNHSLATAKAIWNRIKAQVGMDHPARYALVEIENVHDEGLEFEPIHRALFGLKQDILAEMQAHFGADYAYSPCADQAEMIARVDAAARQTPQQVGVSPPMAAASSAWPTRAPTCRSARCRPSWMASSSKRAPRRSTTCTAPRWCAGWAPERAMWAFTSPACTRTSCSRPSSWMAPCRARPSRWARRTRSASIWSAGRIG